MTLKNEYMLGVDIGSGSLKTTIVRGDGRVVGSASQDLSTAYPHPGWSEQDPEDWYQAFCRTVPQALNQAGLQGKDLSVVCTTAATHTPVLLGEDDRILRPAILWTDQRSSEESRKLNEEHGERLLKIGYHLANPTWTLPMLMWVGKHEPEVAEKTRKVMVAKDYLRFRLTGTWETDYIDALGTLMLDAEKREWSEELCGYIDWPLKTLPPLVEPTRVVGRVGPEAARETSLAEGLPVVAGASDTAAEDYGVGAINPGQGVIKLATAGNTNIMTDRPSPNAKLINYYHVVPGLWYTVAATNSCASAHRWLRDRFFADEMARSESQGKDVFAAMDEIAREARPGSDGLIFHPYLLGERSPYWDSFLRADFVGITMRHQRQHFVRALYEGVAFSLLDCLKSLEPNVRKMEEARIIGGGAQSALWRQIVCNVMNMEVLKTEYDDASFAAALIGGVGVGVFSDEKDAIDRCVKVVSSNKPDRAESDRYQKLFEIYKKTQQNLAEINHELHAFEQEAAKGA